jgi:hypothetical protein
MIAGYEKIVEERIRTAQLKGEFDHLPGAGKPLDFPDDSHVPEDLRLAFKILKNADCLPPEIELKKDIIRTEELLAAMEDTPEKYRAVQRLNFMIMKLNALRNTSVRNELPQKYMDKLVDRVDRSKHKVPNPKER